MKFLPLKNILLIAFSIGAVHSSTAQSVVQYSINTTGSSTTTGGYQLEFTIGDMAIVETFTSSNSISLTNGFLQPLTGVGVLANPFPSFAANEIKIYPIPANENVFIYLQNLPAGSIKIRLHAMGGKTLQVKDFAFNGINTNIPINIAALAAGTYTVTIELAPFLFSTVKKSSYQIIKHH
jgi:hypothetical protein